MKKYVDKAIKNEKKTKQEQRKQKIKEFKGS